MLNCSGLISFFPFLQARVTDRIQKETYSPNMEEDTKPILVPVGGDESNYGIMNIQFNPEDYKCKRYEER